MEKPRKIEFHNDCEKVLHHSLVAVTPEEGCALLVGCKSESISIHKTNHWQIKLIWPCLNIWDSKIWKPYKVAHKKKISSHAKESKSNRFAINPLDQLIAQRWARANNMQVLGTAHSHPNSNGVPSKLDLSYVVRPSLMLILDEQKQINAWWISNNQKVQSIEVAFCLKK